MANQRRKRTPQNKQLVTSFSPERKFSRARFFPAIFVVFPSREGLFLHARKDEKLSKGIVVRHKKANGIYQYHTASTE